MRDRHYASVAMLAMATAMMATGAETESNALKAGWPQLAGPYGTFAALSIETPLVDDLSKARRLWESECADLGRAKGGSQAYRNASQFTEENFTKMGSHPGSWAGLILGDGTLYAASWRPAGAWTDVQGSLVRLDADDFVVAIDPATGKTKWQTFEPGGMLRGGGKRQGFQVGTVYANGTVYSVGSTARIFAHDATTGAKRWESDAHPMRASLKQARENALAGLSNGKWTYDLTPDWCASLAVVGGMLIVPDTKGGFVGIDLGTGERRWTLPGVSTRWATPAAWRHDGREYLLAANEKGELRLIDPVAGVVLWTLAGLGPTWSTLTPGRTHVLVNGTSNSGKAKGQPRVPGRLVAVKLAVEGGTRDWEAPADYLIPVWMDSGARQRIAYADGRFLLPHTSGAREASEGGDQETPSPGQRPPASPAYLLDEATGKPLFRLESSGDRDGDLACVFYICGDRVISRADSFHGPTHGGRHPWLHWSIAANRIERLPGQMDLGEFTNGYEVPMELPFVAGRLFERTEKGTVLCYDLRAP